MDKKDKHKFLVNRCQCNRFPRIGVWKTSRNDPEQAYDTYRVVCECGMMTDWVTGPEEASTQKVVDIWNAVDKVVVPDVKNNDNYNPGICFPEF